MNFHIIDRDTDAQWDHLQEKWVSQGAPGFETFVDALLEQVNHGFHVDRVRILEIDERGRECC